MCSLSVTSSWSGRGCERSSSVRILSGKHAARKKATASGFGWESQCVSLLDDVRMWFQRQEVSFLQSRVKLYAKATASDFHWESSCGSLLDDARMWFQRQEVSFRQSSGKLSTSFQWILQGKYSKSVVMVKTERQVLRVQWASRVFVEEWAIQGYENEYKRGGTSRP